MNTIQKLLLCEKDLQMTFDESVLTVHSCLQEHFAKFDLVRVAQQVADFTSLYKIRLDSISTEATPGSLHLQWYSRESFVLDRRLTQRQNEVIAVHEEFYLPPRLQQQGLSRIFLKIFYNQYQQIRVRWIEVEAGKYVGGYVWAMYGFGAPVRAEVEVILRQGLERGIPADRMQIYQTDVERFYLKQPAGAYPMNVLATSPDGRTLLLSSTWQGVLDLENPEQRAIFESYLASPSAPTPMPAQLAHVAVLAKTPMLDELISSVHERRTRTWSALGMAKRGTLSREKVFVFYSVSLADVDQFEPEWLALQQ